jgi:hypothetical protein
MRACVSLGGAQRGKKERKEERRDWGRGFLSS